MANRTDCWHFDYDYLTSGGLTRLLDSDGVGTYWRREQWRRGGWMEAVVSSIGLFCNFSFTSLGGQNTFTEVYESCGATFGRYRCDFLLRRLAHVRISIRMSVLLSWTERCMVMILYLRPSVPHRKTHRPTDNNAIGQQSKFVHTTGPQCGTVCHLLYVKTPSHWTRSDGHMKAYLFEE